MKKEKFIDFIITQECTYHCVYCSQSKCEIKNKNHASKKTIDNFLRFLDNIEKDFEITITGGEAVCHFEFYDLIKEIKNKGFKINLITNFSFEVSKYKKIFEILDDSLINYDISFHFDEIFKQYKNTNELFEKLEKFLLLKPKTTTINFLFPIFEMNDKKTQLLNELLEFAKNKNITYSYQKIRFLNHHLEKQENNQKTFSKICYAGVKSAVIYEDGNVYRCYSSRFFKTNFLGNINDKNFSLYKKPLPCIFKNCNCPKPLLYNQLTEKQNRFSAYFCVFVNFIYLPFFVFKNSNIIKTKISQLKHLIFKP